MFFFGVIDAFAGDSLLHRVCRLGLTNEDGALFLATKGASTNLANFKVRRLFIIVIHPSGLSIKWH